MTRATVEEVAAHVDSQLAELKETIFMRPPASMEEFKERLGQFKAYYTVQALLKEGLDEEGSER